MLIRERFVLPFLLHKSENSYCYTPAPCKKVRQMVFEFQSFCIFVAFVYHTNEVLYKKNLHHSLTSGWTLYFVDLHNSFISINKVKLMIEWYWFTRITMWTFYFKRKRKRSDSVQWQKPLRPQENQPETWQHTNATKKFDYTTIADQLTVVNLGKNSHPTGVVKPVNGIPKLFFQWEGMFGLRNC